MFGPAVAKKNMSSLPLLAKVLCSLDCMQYAIGPWTDPARPCTVHNVFPFLQFSLPNINGTQRTSILFLKAGPDFFFTFGINVAMGTPFSMEVLRGKSFINGEHFPANPF